MWLSFSFSNAVLFLTSNPFFADSAVDLPQLKNRKTQGMWTTYNNHITIRSTAKQALCPTNTILKR
jgi:hypothetical protein